MRNYTVLFVITLFSLFATPTSASETEKGISTASRNGESVIQIQKAIPIIYGSGRTITDIQEVRAEARQNLTSETQTYRVGFLYNRAHIYFLDIWTWGGEYVIYSGDRYIPITSAQVWNLTGKSEEQLGKPLFYRIPFLLFLVILLLIGSVVTSVFARFLPKTEKKVE